MSPADVVMPLFAVAVPLLPPDETDEDPPEPTRDPARRASNRAAIEADVEVSSSSPPES